MRDETITVFLDQLAARVPAPGGGATAALHAAQAAALLAIVARYSTGGEMERITAEADELRRDALARADAGGGRWGGVAAGSAPPRGREEERQARSAAIAAGLAGAARPPAEVIRT